MNKVAGGSHQTAYVLDHSTALINLPLVGALRDLDPPGEHVNVDPDQPRGAPAVRAVRDER